MGNSLSGIHQSILNFKAKALTSLIVNNYINNNSINFTSNLSKSIELLWIDLYERGFIEIEDVHLAKLWLQALEQVGYQFVGKPVETSDFTEEHLKLLSGGKTMQKLSEEYTEKLYQGFTYLDSKCIQNQAGRQHCK